MLLVTFTGSALATGITRDVRDASNAEESRQDGGYFEVGVGVNVNNSNIFKGKERKAVNPTVTLNMGYQWKGLFVDLNEEEGFVFGYNALNTEHWSFDLIAGPTGEIGEDQSDDFTSLRKRESGVTGGFRATGYFDTNIFQFEIREELTDNHNGYHASMLLGKSWQFRNMNTHAIAGIHHGSAELHDYYWGVRSSEASAEFPQYTAESGTAISAEFGLTYPISESWVLRSKLNYVHISEEIANSPLRFDDKQDLVNLSASISYVF